MNVSELPKFVFADNAGVDAHNYDCLANREKGEKFEVNDEGKLVSLQNRVKYWFSSEYRKMKQDEVADVVTKLLPKLQNQNVKVGDGAKLLNKLSRLSPKLFNRADLKNAGFYVAFRDKVKAHVQQNDVRENEDKNNPIDGTLTDDPFWNGVAECQIAEWSGIHFVRNDGGTSGNYRMKDLDGKTRFLFKPVEESPHGDENPYLSIRIRNCIQRCLHMNDDPSIFEKKGHVREAFASKVCKILNWRVGNTTLVPTTRVGTLDSKSHSSFGTGSSKEGSIQEWIDDCEDGHSRVLKSSISNHKVPVIVTTAILVGLVALAAITASIIFFPAFTAICAPIVVHVSLSALPIIASVGFVALLTDMALVIGWIREKCIQNAAVDPDTQGFKQAALLAYLLCNLDFNPGNMLFKKGTNELHAIDFWFSMPFVHPESWLDIRNMHLWGRLQIATNLISQADIQPILNNINLLRALIQRTSFARIAAQDNHGTVGEEVHFEKRWQVIQDVVKTNGCYKDLANIITETQMTSWRDRASAAI